MLGLPMLICCWNTGWMGAAASLGLGLAVSGTSFVIASSLALMRDFCLKAVPRLVKDSPCLGSLPGMFSGSPCPSKTHV